MQRRLKRDGNELLHKNEVFVHLSDKNHYLKRILTIKEQFKQIQKKFQANFYQMINYE